MSTNYRSGRSIIFYIFDQLAEYIAVFYQIVEKDERSAITYIKK